MAATITWTVNEMTCYPEAEGQTDVVFGVYWVCSGVQDTYSTQVAAPTACDIPLPTASFIPYADLTQEQVLDWVWTNGVDKAAVELQVQALIDVQITPPVVILPLPWTSAVVEDTPVEDTPVELTPVEDTPVGLTPVEETPAEETPAEETPVEETPAEETPAEDTPAEETPVVKET